MPQGADGQAVDDTDWRRSALVGAGAGVWRWDHHAHSVRLCSGAAQLLAGDVGLAYLDLPTDQALKQIHVDDLERLRSRLRAAAYPSPSQIGRFRVRSAHQGDRLVLLAGRTHLSEGGEPSVTAGVVIDLTDALASEEEWFDRHTSDALDDAAHHGIAAYNAIQSSGHASLLQPAKLLLLAIGRAIASRIGTKRTH